MITKNGPLERIASSITDIPTLPASVILVMQKIEDPKTSAMDLAGVLSADPGLAAKVLKLANSPYYGFRSKISSIPQAVSLLGFATLRNTLLFASVFDLFKVSGSGFDMTGLWKHSVAVAIAAKLVAKRVRLPVGDKAFTAGLLHDIGKVIIARYLPTSLQLVMYHVQADEMTMFDAEKKVIAMSHPAFGGWVMEKWGLPPALVEAVEHHHAPLNAQYSFELAGIVYLANALAHHGGLGNGGDSLPRAVDPRVLTYFKLDQSAATELVEALMLKQLEIDTFATLISSA